MTDKEKKKEYRKRRYEDYKLAYAALMLFYPFTLDDLEGEIWRDIKGFERHYQISNYGRVKSFKNGEVKILKPHVDKDGYLQICLSVKGKHNICKVHRLVAETFIINPENKETVNHIDGCKMNNFVGNLEWSTRTENNQHAVRIGLMKSGSAHRDAQLTDEQVAWCRKVHISGDREFGTNALARKLNVSRSAMYLLLNYKTYKNVE